LFTKAHARLGTISDEQITDSTMADISSYAANADSESDVEISDVTERGFSVDERDWAFLLENTRMKGAKDTGAE